MMEILIIQVMNPRHWSFTQNFHFLDILLYFGQSSLHILTILIVDKIWIRNVPKTAGLWNRFLHAVQKSHLPFPYTNWHEEKGSCSDHLKRYKEVKIEVLVVTVINLCFNLVLLTPLLILCKFMSSIVSIMCKYSQLTFFQTQEFWKYTSNWRIQLGC